MTVATKSVPNRRQVSYRNLAEFLAEAETLATSDVTTVGNWSYAQILDHLAASLQGPIDGFGFAAPLHVRLLARLFMRNKLINQEVPPGFKIPKAGEAQFLPDETATVEEALTRLRAAVERFQCEPHRVNHPALGKLTNDEWERFALRHAELHMSFVLPETR